MDCRMPSSVLEAPNPRGSNGLEEGVLGPNHDHKSLHASIQRAHHMGVSKNQGP